MAAWSKLKTRVLSATVLVVLLLCVTFAPSWIFSIAVCIASLVVLRELLTTFQQGKKPILLLTNYVFAIFYMIAGFQQGDSEIGIFLMMTVIYTMILLSLTVLEHKRVGFQDVCVSLFAVFYAVIFLMPLSFMRGMEHGIALLFLAFVGAWIPDTAAYFAGNLFGKHKLIEAISPNKTVEGSVGAIVGAVVGFMIYGGIVSLIGIGVDFFALFFLAVICGVIAQFGDLAASVIKRAYKAKDFGNLIPGHGGFTDRVDSLIFITPIVYYFISYYPVLL